MKENLGLEVLSEIMGWNTTRATDEFQWMKLISRIKYDDYQDFLAGVRFVESFAIWLQQFDKEDRETAYQFVKDKLIYISSAEISKLIDLFFPEVVHKYLVETVSMNLGVPGHQIWCNDAAKGLYQVEKRKILFMALSDGARIDHLRRANSGTINNDQVVVATEVNDQKWSSLHSKLKKAVGDKSAKFSSIYLIDDFSGSGTSVIRKVDGKWTGKIPRFINGIKKLNIEFDTLRIHHYIGTEQAERVIKERLDEAKKDEVLGKFLQKVAITFGMKLSEEIKVSKSSPKFFDLLNKYYDPSIDKPIAEHLRQAGQKEVKLGYGECELPLVLYHNTPNNSIAILWSESTEDTGQHVMRPLFRRMQRHTGDL